MAKAAALIRLKKMQQLMVDSVMVALEVLILLEEGIGTPVATLVPVPGAQPSQLPLLVTGPLGKLL